MQPAEQGIAALLMAPNSLLRLAETLIIAVVALLALLLVGRPVASRLVATLAPRASLPAGTAGAQGARGAAGQQQALPPGQAAQALPGPQGSEDMVSLAMVEGQMRASSITRVQQLVEKHPDETLQVMRRWLTPEEPA